ncbi:MAG: hypothetical protein HUU50_14140 [Candidatus Brocadiae bacterium]|nr:hypothetical protein [Candidatus Brocadiia bacterium]
MMTNKVLKVLIILSLVAAVALSLVGRAGKENNLHSSLSALLIISGFVCGIMSFHTKYSKDFLLPCFMILFIHYIGGNTILNTISLQGMELGESFSGLYKFIVAFTMVVCLKEIFYALRD